MVPGVRCRTYSIIPGSRGYITNRSSNGPSIHPSPEKTSFPLCYSGCVASASLVWGQPARRKQRSTRQRLAQFCSPGLKLRFESHGDGDHTKEELKGESPCSQKLVKTCDIPSFYFMGNNRPVVAHH